MPNINKRKIWVSVGIEYELWLLLRNRAFKNSIGHPKTSIAKELDAILCKELAVKEVAKQ